MKACLRKLVLVVALFGFAPAVLAQTDQRPTHVPNKSDPNGPFGTEWARPGGASGSYIYKDPRRPDPDGAYRGRRSTRCPAPTLYDVKSGRCR